MPVEEALVGLRPGGVDFQAECCSPARLWCGAWRSPCWGPWIWGGLRLRNAQVGGIPLLWVPSVYLEITLSLRWFKYLVPPGSGSRAWVAAELVDFSASRKGKLSLHLGEGGSALEPGVVSELLHSE